MNSNVPRLNGHVVPAQPPADAPRKRTPSACPACGYKYGKAGPWCFNKSCERYRFKKRADTPPLPSARPSPADPLAVTLAELEAARTVVTLLAKLPPASRARVAAWVHVALGG